MNALSILMLIVSHLSSIVGVCEDAETAIKDLVAKNWVGGEAEGVQVLKDLLGLVTAGVISIPGVAAADIQSVLQDLINGVAPVVAAAGLTAPAPAAASPSV